MKKTPYEGNEPRETSNPFLVSEKAKAYPIENALAFFFLNKIGKSYHN